MRNQNFVIIIVVLIILMAIVATPLVLMKNKKVSVQSDKGIVLVLELITNDGQVFRYSSERPGKDLVLKLNNTIITAINVTLYVTPDFIGSPTQLVINGGMLTITRSPFPTTFVSYNFTQNPVTFTSPVSGQMYFVGEWSVAASQIESGPIPDGTTIRVTVNVSNLKADLHFTDNAGNTVIRSRQASASAIIDLQYSSGEFRGLNVSFG